MLFFASSQLSVHPHVSVSAAIHPLGFYRGATSPCQHGSTGLGLSDYLHARTLWTYSLRNRPRPAFPCTLSSHGSHAIGQRSKSLQQIERVCRLTMQLGTPAADSMDIAAAPAWLQLSIASGAGRDANLLLLQFRGLLLQFRV